MTLTDPAFIRRLESLYLLARKILGGSLQSDRRSTKKGAGITFADCFFMTDHESCFSGGAIPTGGAIASPGFKQAFFDGRLSLHTVTQAI